MFNMFKKEPCFNDTSLHSELIAMQHLQGFDLELLKLHCESTGNTGRKVVNIDGFNVHYEFKNGSMIIHSICQN